MGYAFTANFQHASTNKQLYDNIPNVLMHHNASTVFGWMEAHTCAIIIHNILLTLNRSETTTNVKSLFDVAHTNKREHHWNGKLYH